MTHIIVLFGGLFVGALSGVLAMAALVAAGTASELEWEHTKARHKKIAGPSGGSPSYLRGPGSGSHGRDTSPYRWGFARESVESEV